MHTVIILNERSSDLLKDFRFLFKPFVDEGMISFCDWNESGTDIKSSVPDLYKLIKGKPDWRAIVVSTDSMYEYKGGPVADEKNPFDFPEEAPEDEVPKVSNVPLIRLAHMICGYPASMAKNFEKGFEYYDEDSCARKRVRESELSVEEICQLSEKYGEKLKSIYMEEPVSEEVKNAQKEICEKYSFTDIRPREMIFAATRKHRKDEDHIYASWKNQIEMESSNFCNRNKYPNNCRFLCYSITNAENSMYMKELIEFWLAVLTLSVNKIPASELQAYRLYRLGIEISEEEMDTLLNKHLNKMESVYAFVQERLRMRPDYSFEEGEELVDKQEIPVIFEGVSGSNMYISTKHIGLSRDYPEDELLFWNAQIQEKRREITQYLKTPRRAVDKAAQRLKSKTEGFLGDEYELDRFQVEDLKEEIENLEQEVLESDTRSAVDESKIKEEIREIDRKVKKDISARMRRNLIIGVGAMALVIYLGGYVPYLVHAMQLGSRQFFSSLLLVIIALAFAALGGVTVLFILRFRIVESMERYNRLIRQLVNSVNTSAGKFEKYFSAVCTYMKAQSIYVGTHLKSDSLSSERFMLRAHKQALRISIARDEELAASYGIRRMAEAEKNVTSFFDGNRLPKDNRLYYFDPCRLHEEIPLNNTGDFVQAPYKFVSKLKIEREDIYDIKGDS